MTCYACDRPCQPPQFHGLPALCRRCDDELDGILDTQRRRLAARVRVSLPAIFGTALAVGAAVGALMALCCPVGLMW